MAAWQHLVLEEGQDDKPDMERATALLDMTKCFEQVRLSHVWRWGCHWGFPKALLRTISVVFSFLRRVVLWGQCPSRWLVNGLDFHVSKDEEGVDLERLTQSGTDFSNESARREGRLARAHPGRRRVRSGRRTQYARLTKVKKRMPKVQFYKSMARSRARSPRRGSCQVACTA